jgi:stage II sporulation protein D (peptidoglycan lytic transglycosylase)
MMGRIFKVIFLSLILGGLGFPHSSEALDSFVKVQVFSRYDLHEVEITATLARLRIEERGKGQVEASWPPQIPLKIKAEGKKLTLQIGTSLTRADQAVVEPPRGSFLSVRAGPDLERKFVGRLSIRAAGDVLSFVEELPLEDYVRGVLEAEIPVGFPPEALKAQAVLIRTFALAHRDRHQKEGFDFCDLTHCQVYAGRNYSYRSFDEAVKETQGLILAHELKPVEALYHSTCGGHTSPFHKVFGGKPIPYLMGVSDGSYCSKSPHASWESSIPLKILEEVLKKDPDTHPKGDIQNLRPADREENGRVFTLALEGQRNFVISAQKFLSVVGRYLGWNKVKSNWFDVEVKDGEAHFKGHGLGHGVGLCQWGAKGMAEEGKKFDEILFHYFPGTQLVER